MVPVVKLLISCGADIHADNDYALNHASKMGIKKLYWTLQI